MPSLAPGPSRSGWRDAGRMCGDASLTPKTMRPEKRRWCCISCRTEEKLRETRAGPTVRALTRALESQPIIERLHHALLLWKTKRRFLPKSNMGKAIDYALEQWSSLLFYLDDGRLEIDNNLVENAIGKKNWLFIGEANAGERGAIIYTIIESCRRREIDPYEYMRDVFTRLPNSTNWQVKDLTPEAWAKARKNRDLKAAA